eukprot:UN06576
MNDQFAQYDSFVDVYNEYIGGIETYEGPDAFVATTSESIDDTQIFCFCTNYFNTFSLSTKTTFLKILRQTLIYR